MSMRDDSGEVQDDQRVSAKVVEVGERTKEPMIVEKVGSVEPSQCNGEEVTVTSCKSGRVEGKVIQETQNLGTGNELVAGEMMKEDVNPLMRPSGGKPWKRLARSMGTGPIEGQSEQKTE
ncbi:uncharacterized protein G2W53_010956 [Senna tora]|uniref:Uncharacterized protein n=1 Tax=Senna tora TaxID=362788 RepID=A0A834X202_9FABA|nr:uncharacterized protein G2W53_010956 [Senna tora]